MFGIKRLSNSCGFDSSENRKSLYFGNTFYIFLGKGYFSQNFVFGPRIISNHDKSFYT